MELTERLEGTLAATALAAADGATMFRVHEVGPTRRVLEMVASIRGERPPTRTVRDWHDGSHCQRNTSGDTWLAEPQLDPPRWTVAEWRRPKRGRNNLGCAAGAE